MLRVIVLLTALIGAVAFEAVRHVGRDAAGRELPQPRLADSPEAIVAMPGCTGLAGDRLYAAFGETARVCDELDKLARDDARSAERTQIEYVRWQRCNQRDLVIRKLADCMAEASRSEH